jgi:hypothetical protein
MKKYFLMASIFLSSYISFSQTDSVYAKVEITSVSMIEHRKWIDTSIVILLNKFEHTGIINLGKIDEIQIGLQFELFKSDLGEKDKIILGIAFFTKEEEKWKMYQNPIYNPLEYKIIKSKADIVEDEYIGRAGTSIQDLQVEYQTHLFIIRM